MSKELSYTDGQDGEVSERSRSNLSIGYNHAPESPMRHRSSNNVELGDSPNWPTTIENKNPAALFVEELESGVDGVMTFDKKDTSPQAKSDNTAKFGKEEEADSVFSRHSGSRLESLANLELVW